MPTSRTTRPSTRWSSGRKAAGDFTIHEKAFEAEFWRYFTDDSMHDFFEPGTEAGAFEVPPWQQGSDEG